MRTFDALVTREGKWWMIGLPQIDGLTQARRLSEAELMAREFVASSLDLPLSDVAVRIELDVVGDVRGISETVASIRKERSEAQALESDAARSATLLAKQLVAENVPLRDVGTVLGISYQRAHQLVRS